MTPYLRLHSRGARLVVKGFVSRFNTTYRAFFKDVPVLPARTTVQSVLWNAIKVEIDCIARKPA
jgi:enamine deaminase RidA (YjgF/YER057c/UK114 family)